MKVKLTRREPGGWRDNSHPVWLVGIDQYVPIAYMGSKRDCLCCAVMNRLRKSGVNVENRYYKLFHLLPELPPDELDLTGIISLLELTE